MLNRLSQNILSLFQGSHKAITQTSNTNENTLSLQDFTVTLQGTKLLHIPHFEIKTHQLIHIHGSNGVGKTTLLRALAGELPSTGSIAVGGGYPGSLLARQAMIYVPTDVYLPEDLKIEEYLRFMAAAWQVPEGPSLKLAEQFGLSPWLSSWPNVLSRGTRQKVALAAALGLSRPVTLLDEPFGTLDRSSRDVLLQAIQQRRLNGGTILVTTHGDELIPLKPTILELYEGGIAETRSTDSCR